MRKPSLVVVGIIWAGLISGGLGWWAGKTMAAPSGPDLKDFHLEHLAQAPEQGSVVMSFDAEWILDALIDKNMGLFEAKDPEGTRAALSAAGKKHLGIDLLAAKRAQLWMAPSRGMVGLWLEGDFDGSLKGEAAEYAGRTVARMPSGAYMAKLNDGLLIGDERGLQATLDLAAGEAKSVDVALHEKALDEVDDGSLIVSFGGEAALPMGGDVEGGAVALEPTGTFTSAIIGKPTALARMAGSVLEAHDKARDAISEALERFREVGPAEAVLPLTLAKHKLEDVFAVVEIEHDGELLTAQSEGRGGLVAIYIATTAATAYTYFLRAKSQMEMMRIQQEQEQLWQRELRDAQ